MIENPNYRPLSIEQHGEDKSKTIVSRSGLKIVWYNAVDTVTREPGIDIRLVMPNGDIKENVHFSFGEEDKAQAKFDEFVAFLKRTIIGGKKELE